MSTTNESTLGQIAFEAYGDNREWKDWRGMPMPAWTAVSPEVQAAWEVAAKAVSERVRQDIRMVNSAHLDKQSIDALYAKHREVLAALGESNTPIMLELDGIHTMLLIGLLQLTTRHPALPARSHAYARELATQLTAAVTTIAPGAAEVVELGWRPEFDQKAARRKT